MAERALFSIAGQIIGSLSSPAFQEIGLVWGVNDEFQELKEMVKQLQAVLLDAEQKQANSSVQEWLESLEDAVYDADDVLDEFHAEAQWRRSQIMLGQVSKQVRKFFSSSNPIAFRRKMGHKIKDINRRLQDIASRRNFILEELREDTRFITRERVTHSCVPRKEIIGRDDDQSKIEKLLLDPNYEKNVSTISIVGFGGLGKTALAQLVFNDKVVQDHFNLRIWTTVSNVFELEIVVKKILKSKTNDMDQLQDELRKKVDGKRYLLVLDDVWNENRQKWLSLENLLMGGARGSRILITTRSEIVATNSGAIEKYLLKGLDEEQSWSLFKNMAFKDGTEPENPTIKTAAVETAKKCQGVPLAIKTIGGMLYSNHEEIEWLNFKNKKFLEISQQENDITPTLKLSYDALPSDLKHCFAYCCLFPPDYEIPVDMLIKLWMAQGFIKSSYKNECLEDVGFAYYKELLRRSFFQEEEKDAFGKIRSCKMHDLMNELAISVAGKRSTIVDLDHETFDGNHRHISFNFLIDLSQWKIPNSMWKATKMRTFLFLGQGYYDVSAKKSVVKSFCSTIVSNFKYLRMLSLNKLGIQSLPNSLRKLKHLKYLDLSDNLINRLPDWIVGLVSLETLDLSQCYFFKELPRDIKKMVNLRHLVLEGCSQLQAMPHGVSELTCLHTLDKFVVNEDGASLGELSRLTELRGNLEINNLCHGEDHLLSLYDRAILKEKHLDSLTLEWSWIGYEDTSTAHESSVFMLLEALQPHSNVKQLSVKFYSGLRFPNWLSYLINISHLTLTCCRALQHLPPLDHLPFLRVLHLLRMDSLEFIMISTPTSTLPTTFFPSLKEVVLHGCPNLKGWLMEPIRSSCSSSTAVMPSFPCLSNLKVSCCPKLTSMPLYPNLDRLWLEKSSWDFLPWVVPVTGEAYDIGVSILPFLQIQDMEFVPEGIGNLTSLQSLEIHSCSNLASLPQGIGNLASLQSLSIYNCRNLASLPEGIGNLASLQSLSIDNCPNLASLPQRIGNLPSLKSASLPEGIGNLASLQSLSIYDCRNLASLPEGIGNLPSLQSLEIYNCPNLAFLPEGIGNLASLQSLSILHCRNLASLAEGIGKLASLQSLKIHSCSLALLPEGIGNLAYLQSLSISNCPNLASLPEGIGNLASLQSLSLLHCRNWASLPEGIGNLAFLQSLSIYDCRNLASLPEGIGNLAYLQSLSISNCPNLASLPEGIGNLASLQSLSIYNCPNLASLPEGISHLDSLKTLRIDRCPIVEKKMQERNR